MLKMEQLLSWLNGRFLCWEFLGMAQNVQKLYLLLFWIVFVKNELLVGNAWSAKRYVKPENVRGEVKMWLWHSSIPLKGLNLQPCAKNVGKIEKSVTTSETAEFTMSNCTAIADFKT